MLPIWSARDGACSCPEGENCATPAKHPMNRNGASGASVDAYTVGRWFHDWRGCNWALATGKRSSVWVLDIDTAKGGEDSFREWLDKTRAPMFPTFTVWTGGGGWHYYFSMPYDGNDVRNRVSLLRSESGIDVRGTGGYVLLPGSNHISGREYISVRDVEPVQADERLVAFARGPGHSGGSPSASGRSIGGEKVAPLDHYLKHGFTPGARDNECYKLACSLWRTHWNDPQFVEAAIADVWRATKQGDHPFPWSQAKHKIRVAREFVESEMRDELAFLRTFGGMK